MVLTADDACVGLGIHIEEFENVDVIPAQLGFWN